MIVKFSQLVRLRKKFRNKKIVFAGGTFDLFHKGHVDALKNLRKFGDVVVIAVSSDKRVRERKGPKRPILGQKERLVLMDSIRYVDYALISPEPRKHQKMFPTIRIISALRPDVFVTSDRRWLLFKSKVEALGTKFKLLPHVKSNSTTRIIRRVVERYKD